MNNSEKTMEKIVALCKGRGFVYSGSEIYGGLANTWDYGPLGVEFKNNVKAAWRKKFVQESPYNVGLDSSLQSSVFRTFFEIEFRQIFRAPHWKTVQNIVIMVLTFKCVRPGDNPFAAPQLSGGMLCYPTSKSHRAARCARSPR